MGFVTESERVGLQVNLFSKTHNYNAVGIFDGRGITILKGSSVSAKVRSAKLDAELLTEDMLLTQDVYFPTPDAAAKFVTGRPAIGLLEWRTESGVPLKSAKPDVPQEAPVPSAPTKDLPAKGLNRSPALSGWSKQDRRTRNRLHARIAREFEKKFFIGDIAVSDQEFALLLKEYRELIPIMVQRGSPLQDDMCLAVTLVQIGIRKYDGRHFWPYVGEEFGIKCPQKHQQLLGDSFVNTLRAHGKHITDASERVQNILFHGFVSDFYSKGLFELLFQFYSKDLERSIEGKLKEQMQSLMDTLARKATLDEAQSDAFVEQFMVKGSRAYKLKSHTLQAISAYPVHSRTRLRRLLRLINRAFWDGAVPKNPTSRLTILFKEWINDSDAYKKEYRLYQQGEIRNRGKKHFSTPYLFASIGEGRFALKLPGQIVAEEYSQGLFWEIATKERTFRLEAETYPVLTGIKTEEMAIDISRQELFGEISTRLVCREQNVRRFPLLSETTVRFFDMDGDCFGKPSNIPMCAYTPVGLTLQSAALISEVPHGNITRWDFEFQQGDLVVLPDGTGMTVGDRYTEGLIPRGQVLNTEYRDERGNAVPVYASPPELLLTIPQSKFPGTVLYCNDRPYRLSDCDFTEFEAGDARGQQAVVVPTKQFGFCDANGLKTIVLDVPGHHYDKAYSFVLVRDFSAEFPGAPYVFKEHGAVLFPAPLHVSGDYEKLQGENGFRFALDGNEPQLKITVEDGIPLSVSIPMFSWSTDRKSWDILPAGELWHTEFFSKQKLYLRGPADKIRIFTDADIDDDDDSGHTIQAERGADGVFTADMTRFRSWLTRDVVKNDIFLKMGGVEYRFATVYTRSIVSSYDVPTGDEEDTLTWISDIIGQAEYFLDITHLESGAVLAEKAKLTDGKITIRSRLRTGRYRFALYEAESEEDDGFDEPVYNELLRTERQLTNKNDVSGQFLEVRSFKRVQYSNRYNPFGTRYCVADLEKIGKNRYEGRMYAGGALTDMKVTLEFVNPEDMRYFHLTAWHAEEDRDVDLLFDSKTNLLALDQLPGLRSSESYCRYRELTYGEFVYFGILRDSPPKELQLPNSPADAVMQADSTEPNSCSANPEIPVEPKKAAEKPGKPAETGVSQEEPNAPDYTGSRSIALADMGFSCRTYLALNKKHVNYSGDLEKLKPFDWQQLKKELGSIRDVQNKMNELGLRIKEK